MTHEPENTETGQRRLRRTEGIAQIMLIRAEWKWHRTELWFGLATATALLLKSLAAEAAPAEGGEAHLRASGTNVLIQIRGGKGDDWRLDASEDLIVWTNWTAFGTLLSGGKDAPEKALSTREGSQRFLRAVRTSGLYDPVVLRTFNLTFTQANWQTRLTSGRRTGSNTLGNLILDNGAVVTGIGARYRGNTSFDMGGAKKSLNIEMDFSDPSTDLMGFSTVNLNNAAGDETIMREPLYFTVMSQYAVSPKGAMARLFINNTNWGVYSLAQQQDGDLIDAWFPSNDGDRWRAPNMAGGGGGPGGGPGGGGFGGSTSALSWLGTNISRYMAVYELKKQNSTNAWEILVHAIDVLNNTPTSELRGKVEDVLAVDRWLWFLVLENLFADDDSYWNKGADYMFYYEPESGRIHPVEHDGNESFMANDSRLSPVTGATTARPVLYKLLGIPELRQRYLAHMRTVMEESFNPRALTALIDRFHQLSVKAIAADPKKGFTMAAYTNDLRALKTFITNRYNFLSTHAELTPVAPLILAVDEPAPPNANQPARVTVTVDGAASGGVQSVWLHYRGGATGKFSRTEMFDDGAHDDGAAGDGVYGGETAGFMAGVKVSYYIEARAGNPPNAARFVPARAEEDTFSYRVNTAGPAVSPVVLNEFMADNVDSFPDPQGDFDDWIELRNTTNQEVDLTGHFLTDNPDNLRKWQFPDGTVIPAGGYLIVWADEDGQNTPGLHASFKLSNEGETLLFVGPDNSLNPLLDSVTFGAQDEGRSLGRSPADANQWVSQNPTPGAANE